MSLGYDVFMHAQDNCALKKTLTKQHGDKRWQNVKNFPRDKEENVN